MAKKTQEVIVKVVTPRTRKPRKRNFSRKVSSKNPKRKKDDTVQAIFERLERVGVPPEKIPKEEIRKRLREEEIKKRAEVTPEEVEEIAEELEHGFPVRARIRKEEERIRSELREIERKAEPVTRLGEAGIRTVARIGRILTQPKVRREARRLFAGVIPREKREPRARRIMREPEERGVLGDFGTDFFDVSFELGESLDLGDLSFDMGLTDKKGRKGMGLGDVLKI